MSDINRKNDLKAMEDKAWLSTQPQWQQAGLLLRAYMTKANCSTLALSRELWLNTLGRENYVIAWVSLSRAIPLKEGNKIANIFGLDKSERAYFLETVKKSEKALKQFQVELKILEHYKHIAVEPTRQFDIGWAQNVAAPSSFEVVFNNARDFLATKIVAGKEFPENLEAPLKHYVLEAINDAKAAKICRFVKTGDNNEAKDDFYRALIRLYNDDHKNLCIPKEKVKSRCAALDRQIASWIKKAPQEHALGR